MNASPKPLLALSFALLCTALGGAPARADLDPALAHGTTLAVLDFQNIIGSSRTYDASADAAADGDAFLIASLPAGAYSAPMAAASSGHAMFELYDVTP